MAITKSSSDRIKAALAAAALEGLLAYALITGLAMKVPAAIGEHLVLLGITPPPPPPVRKTVPPPTRATKPQGAASPPNLMAKPTEVVAPVPLVAPVVPPPIAAAPVAGPGSDPSAGASDIAGPGTGSGGQGTGLGSGGSGDGGGGGGGGSPPRWVKGKIENKDYPRAAGDAGVEGVVSVRFTVETDGRATRCAVTHSSGSEALDETTCRLIEARFRYKPARDSNGRPVRSTLIEDHEWLIHEGAPADAPPSQ